MNPIEFARNLFALRMEHRMTIEALAEALEVSPELICEWECAKTSPSLEQMTRLAKIYAIPLDEIIRNPKPHAPVAAPAPAPVEEVAPPPVQEEPPQEPAQEAEILPENTEDEPKAPSRLTDALIIALILGIIAAATVFLIKPEWFPWLG